MIMPETRVAGPPPVPECAARFDKHGLHGCGGEHGPAEPLFVFASVHQVDLDQLLRELNAEVARPNSSYVYHEAPEDYIYRRFFKAGISIATSVGALWGALNLLQIAMSGSFLCN